MQSRDRLRGCAVEFDESEWWCELIEFFGAIDMPASEPTNTRAYICPT